MALVSIYRSPRQARALGFSGTSAVVANGCWASGPLRDFGLADARERARRARMMLADNIDPIAAKRAAKAVKVVTFREAAEAYNKLHEKKWTADRPQFLPTLKKYAFPILGNMDVRTIDMALVLRCVEPLWGKKTETMSRTRQRIEAVLDYATVSGYRTGDNPARWDGNLAIVLPSPAAIAPVKHHPALPWRETAAFVAALRKREGVAAPCARIFDPDRLPHE